MSFEDKDWCCGCLLEHCHKHSVCSPRDNPPKKKTLSGLRDLPVHFSEAPPTCNQGCRVPAQWRSASYRFNGPVWTRLNIELNWTFPCWIELFPHWIELFSTLRQRYRKYKMLDGTVIFDRFDLGKAESIMLGSFVGVVKVDESYSDPLPFFFLSKIKCQNTKSPS